MSLTATFDPILSRVRLAATDLDNESLVVFDRSRNGIKWTSVRGGAAGTPPSLAIVAEEGFEGAGPPYAFTTSNGGSANWAPSTSEFHAGAKSLQSGSISNGQVSDFSMTTPAGAKTLRLWHKLDAGTSDLLRVFVNGVQRLEVVESGDWNIFEYPVSAGEIVMLRYIRNVGGGSNAAWVDQVQFLIGESNLDDYEFIPGEVNHYRVSTDDISFTTTITPSQDDVWFKSITRPFLNRPVTVVSHGDITLPARNSVLSIIGRSDPIGVTDVRLSRRWDMTIKAETVADADALELVFASGDPIYIQVPADGNDIPGGYVLVGDVVRRRFGHLSQRRWFDLPITRVAPPGPDVVGTTVTWEALVAEFGSWTDVLAAFGTWADVLEYVASPESVIVP